VKPPLAWTLSPGFRHLGSVAELDLSPRCDGWNDEDDASSFWAVEVYDGVAYTYCKRPEKLDLASPAPDAWRPLTREELP